MIVEIKENIRDFIVENMVIYDDDVTFTDADNIFELGFVDSMFALKLVTFIETEFEIKVGNEDLNLANFSSVDNIVNFVNKKSS
ncbi:MAG: acyl carrier protein [Halanaerobiales bacterium]|nr:acyl carrier protein [Halanaerobiales bacterium]